MTTIISKHTGLECAVTDCAVCGGAIYTPLYYDDGNGNMVRRERFPTTHNGHCSVVADNRRILAKASKEQKKRLED